jgi:hypothetical protein
MIDGKISKDVEGAYKENYELNSDEETLKALGYKLKELNRSMSKLTNFAVSFTIISILTGISSMFVQGLVYGGPMVLVWGWYQRQTLGLFAMWGTLGWYRNGRDLLSLPDFRGVILLECTVGKLCF